KEALDHVEPGCRRRSEMKVKARMSLEPAFDRRGLVSGIVVDDQMEIETGQGPLIDQLEKAQEIAMATARHAGSDDFAVQHVECGTARWLRPIRSPMDPRVQVLDPAIEVSLVVLPKEGRGAIALVDAMGRAARYAILGAAKSDER